MVPRLDKYPAVSFAGIATLSALIAGLTLWVLSKAEKPFDYMVVGTLATTLLIALVFLVLVKRRML